MSLPNAPRIASGLITACITHIRELSQLLDEPSKYPYRAPLCHEFSRFRLWTRSFKTPRANSDILDEVLEASVYLQEPTVILLASFASCLLDDCLQKVGNDDTRVLLEQSLSDVDKAYPCLDTAALRRVWGAPNAAIGELRECVDTLFDVLSTLDNVMEQMKEDKLEKVFWEEPGAPPSASVMGGHWEIYQQYIRDRFPGAVGIDIEGFAKGNAYCFDRLMGMEQGYLVSEPAGQSVHLPPLPEESATHINTSQRALEQMKDVPLAGGTTFKDSWLGSSAAHSHPQAPIRAPDQLPATIPASLYLAPAPSVSSFTRSTICSVSSEPGKRRLLPKVPEHSQYGAGFKCTFCGLNQRPTTQGHRWRKHVFADLTPYMCIRTRCSGSGAFYNSRKSWVAHDTACIRSPMEGDRAPTRTECPFCLKKFDRNIGGFYSHVAHHMEDIRLFALPAAYREHEEDEHRDSSESGSTDGDRSIGEDRGALGQYLALNSGVHAVSTSGWVLETQGGVENSADQPRDTEEWAMKIETPQYTGDAPGTLAHDDRIDPTITESQLSKAQTEKKASTLWEEAFRKIREPNKGHPWQCEALPKGSLVENIIKHLKERKKQCDDGRWFIIEDDRKVFIVENLLVELARYEAIGELSLEHSQDIVALVWDGFRGLSQVGTAYINLMPSVAEILYYLVKVLCCCDIYEKLYCNTKFDISQDLNGCFVDLYVSILKYLHKHGSYLDYGRSGRRTGAFTGEIAMFLNKIKSNETRLIRIIDVAEKEASASNGFNQDASIGMLRGFLVAIQEPMKETSRIVEIIYNKVERDTKLKILTWLSEVNYEIRHLQLAQRRQRGTCSWLLDHGLFIEWRDEELKRILWLYGSAGSGKSYVASAIVDSFGYLSARDDHVVAYFYCSINDAAGRSTESILRTLVKQFCVKVEENKLPTLVDAIYKKREVEGNARDQLTSEECTQLIIGLSEKYQSTTIIVDALDECDAEALPAFLSSLQKIAQDATRIKIFVTSRYNTDLHRFFSHVPTCFMTNEISADINSDINLYIEDELNRRCDANNASCGYELLLGGLVDQELRELVATTLQSKSNGTSFWVDLQIHALCAARTVADVRSVLDRMPETLNETYLQILEVIRAQDLNAYRVAEDILKWLLYGQDSCTTMSVIQALAVEPGKQTLNQDGLGWMISKVLGVCKGLVLHNEDLDIFVFAHPSVQEFLLSQKDYEGKACNTYIAGVCLTTLQYHHAGDYRIQDVYAYAARHWAAHVRASKAISGIVVDLCIEFLKPHVPYSAWGNTMTELVDDLKGEVEDIVPPFWVACYYQLHHVPECLLRASNLDLNSRNTHGRTPLSWAAEQGHEEMVQLLLGDRWVDVNSRDSKYGKTPLSFAAAREHAEVVELLLRDSRVDVNFLDSEGRTPLAIAVERGNEEVVQLLLKGSRVDVNIPDRKGRTPLIIAVEGGHAKVVKLLLRHLWVDVNIPDNEGRTPFAISAERGHEEVVELLLQDLRVDMNIPDNEGRTPLATAVEGGHAKVVKLLLRYLWVVVNIPDNEGRTPFAIAAERGHEEVVELLLQDSRVDMNIPDNEGRTPLAIAVERGHEEVVQLLLEDSRVDVNIPDNEGRTPFAIAVERGHEKVVQLLLLDSPVDVNIPDSKGRTPLAIAVERSHERMVGLLLRSSQANVNIPDNEGRTPFAIAVERGHEEVVELLLRDSGVDVNIPDSKGRTPLAIAVERGHEEVVGLLLRSSQADVTIPDNEGHTPLDIARGNSSQAIITLLENKEADLRNYLNLIHRSRRGWNSKSVPSSPEL